MTQQLAAGPAYGWSAEIWICCGNGGTYSILISIYLMTFLRKKKKIPYKMGKIGPWRSLRMFTRVGTYVQRGSKFCFVVLVADRLNQNTALLSYFTMLSAYSTIACTVQPCPAALQKNYKLNNRAAVA
jgi:hypothetical protein